jgi:hypothetical protein
VQIKSVFYIVFKHENKGRLYVRLNEQQKQDGHPAKGMATLLFVSK